MQRTRKRLLLGIVCACVCIVLGLLLTVVLAPRLLANRDLVKSYIVKKTAQTTGGQLDYDRIEIDFFPLPHLAVQNVDLALPGTFSVRAHELSVYPRLMALLRGRLSIHRLRLSTPDIRVNIPKTAEPAAAEAKDAKCVILPAIENQIGSVFKVLPAIDPGTQVEIHQGRLTLDFTDNPDIQIHAINAIVENSDHELSFDFSCASDLIKKVTLQATADVAHSKAKGNITLTVYQSATDPFPNSPFPPASAWMARGPAQPLTLPSTALKISMANSTSRCRNLPSNAAIND